MNTLLQATTKLPTGRAPTPTSFVPILVGARPIDNFSPAQPRSPSGPHVLVDIDLNRRIIAGRFEKLNHQKSKQTESMMRVVTVLNRCTKFKRFVFSASRFDEKNGIVVELQPRKNSKPACSRCGMVGATYDTSPEPRQFEFIGMWGFPVFFEYRMRRVNCARCGVVVESVPWSKGKHHLTDIYQCFLAHWAKKLSWKEVAESFRTSWEKVYHSVKFVVAYGLEHRPLDNVTAIGVDEIHDPVLCKTRFCFLKRKENLTEKQSGRLSELLKMNLRTVKAYLLKEDFQRFWEYVHPTWAGKFLDRWCNSAMKSRIDPMKDIAKMLRSHRELILNWFRAKKRFNSGIVEGLNLKWNLTVRKSFGFRTSEALKTASYHQLGDLPEPELTHRFY
jgi:transposase